MTWGKLAAGLSLLGVLMPVGVRLVSRRRPGETVGAAAARLVDSATGGLVPFNDLKLEQLRQIAPRLAQARAVEMLPHLVRAMREHSIDSTARRAAFLAQLMHESAELRYFEELASGDAYEGRRDLGNLFTGDGRRYKGRGPIQLTGRSNYRAAGEALGLALEENPELAATPEVGFRVAGWYWTSRGLNALADEGNFREITRRINGGYNGLEERVRYWEKAKAVLS